MKHSYVGIEILEPSCELERTLPPFFGRFCIENGCGWCFLCYSGALRGTPALKICSFASLRKRIPMTVNRRCDLHNTQYPCRN